jgi:hypothetical protein
MSKRTPVSPDQLQIAQMLHRDTESVMKRIEAFTQGRLFIWSNPVERQDSAGNVHTLKRGEWLEVTCASALFIRDAKYEIREVKWRVPTDEDAKNRPLCRVRDSENLEWQDGKKLIAVLNCEDYCFLTVNAGYAMQNASSWKYCEIAEESSNEVS